jgi:hypothetical protein
MARTGGLVRKVVMAASIVPAEPATAGSKTSQL